MKERIRIYDLLKGICILCVIITHYAWSDAERLNPLFPFVIEMAVPIFMLITGKLWTKSIMEKYGSSEGGYKLEYILHKLIVFGVPFMVTYFVEMMAYSVIKGVDCKFVLLSLLKGGLGPGSYYFPVLVQMLFIFPIIMYLINKYDFFGLILCFVINLFYEIMKIAYGMNEECYRMLAFRYIFVVAVGCYLQIGKKHISNCLKLLFMLVGAFFISLTTYTSYEPMIFTYWTGTSMMACMFICPIICIVFEKWINVSCKPLEIIGQASYEIFLIQMVYYWCVPSVLYVLVEEMWIRLLINIFVNIGVGILFHFIVTKIIRWIGLKTDFTILRKKILTGIDKINK